jgi:N-acyl-L-homoserine lactone synthetase
MLEHAVMDASKPLKVRAKAFELGLEAVRAYCAVRGVVPKCTVTTLGMKRFMERRGWHAQRAIPMYLWPLELEIK